MDRPPIKAFEAVRKYCEKNKTCDGCPLKSNQKGVSDWCAIRPCHWKSLEEEDLAEIIEAAQSMKERR